MFGVLTEKFQHLFSSLGKGRQLTEENLTDAVREVRLALLEADVNYSVASTLVKRIKEEILGTTLLKSVTPQQQFAKIVHEELTKLMGEGQSELVLSGKPAVLMLCGLQGSGKTTHCAKLAHFLQKQKASKKILMVACDLQRPAAVQQLQKLGLQIGIDVFSIENETDPKKVAKKALEKAKAELVDYLIVDTAGRLHLDVDLMDQLKDLQGILEPSETLFVVNATIGQDAVKTAVEFDKKVAITGTILTMLDGDARAGAAISIREVTQKPLKFEGIGEKIADLQPFHPRSMADRILGMGDMINLVRQAEEHIDEKESERLKKKLKKASFTYEDYLKQMNMLKKMGSFTGLLKMLPGASALLGKIDIPEAEIKQMESIIFSMTVGERQEIDELSYSRRKRIAKGCGNSIDTVNRLVKGFKRAKLVMKKMPLDGKKGLPNINELKNHLGGNIWR